MNTPAPPPSPRRALVTGGSGAIGAAICERLARDGLHVIVHANANVAAADALVARLAATGASAEAVRFDVTDRPAVEAACAALLEAGPIQVLVNNAGVHDDAAFPALSDAQWHRPIDTSLHGFFHVTHALTMPMVRTRFGRIVNMSSVAALAGHRGQVNYAAAKGALNSATKSLAQELATRGITVNAVAPGIIESPMIASAFDATTIAQRVPMRRAGRPEEVAALVAFLVSDEAAYITGQIVSINGGLL